MRLHREGTDRDDNDGVRTRIVALGACILGTTVTSGLAWAAVDRVETRITTSEGAIVSPRGVDLAVAPFATSSSIEPLPFTVTTAGNEPTSRSAPSTAPQVPSNAPTTAKLSSPPPMTRPASSNDTVTTTAPPTVAISTTTAPPSTTAPPTGQSPTVIPTVGGTIAVACPTPGTIRLVYATPNPGYVYAPIEITALHVHVKFTKSGRSVVVEAECSDGRVETSVENDD